MNDRMNESIHCLKELLESKLRYDIKHYTTTKEIEKSFEEDVQASGKKHDVPIENEGHFKKQVISSIGIFLILRGCWLSLHVKVNSNSIIFT